MPEIDIALIDSLSNLRPRQFERVVQLVNTLAEGTTYSIDPESDFVTREVASDFGDQLRLHHNASAIPFTKDKFEYALVSTLNDAGHEAEKMANGNPGADITVDGVPWSLKTQADASIKADKLHISKYMELGKGAWETAGDVAKLREKMFGHMTKYERIFSLRCLIRTPVADGSIVYGYELVEIPKSLLARSANSPIEMKVSSGQVPKPASCSVYSDAGPLDFELYFDGGTERKLQIRNLAKRNCLVHATWTFTATS